MERREVSLEELQQLTEHFRALGARRPEMWAKSQLEEGKPRYARLVFLRQAWKAVIDEGSTSWIDSLIQQAKRHPRHPGSSAGPALERLLAAGSSPQDLAEVVRVMQWELLHSIAYLVSDPSKAEYPTKEMPRAGWALFEVDEAGKPLSRIAALHESVLDTDPTGREMMPKKDDHKK